MHRHRRPIVDSKDQDLLDVGFEFSGLVGWTHPQIYHPYMLKEQALELMEKLTEKQTLKYRLLDITTVKKGVIAHGCNCRGAFGSGVAGAIRLKWPKVFHTFNQVGTGSHLLGQVQIIQVDDDLYVINCFTQDYYGSDGKRYASSEAIKQALIKVYSFANEIGVNVWLPKIGAGLGGLDWDTEVEPIIVDLDKHHNKIMTNICVIDNEELK